MGADLTTLIDELKSRLKLEDMVRAAGIELKKDGKNLVGLCPWHTEATGSFKIKIGENYARCFGCGKSADPLTWISWIKFHKLQTEQVEFIEVLKEACQITGVKWPEPERALVLKKEADAKAKPKHIFESIDRMTAGLRYKFQGPGERVVDPYVYTNPETKAAELVVFRIETPKGKQFRQARPEGTGFVFGGLPRNPLYNRTRLAAAKFCVLCYSADTEILTRRGWILFSLLNKNDDVAQYDPDSEQIGFVRPSARQIFDYLGLMVNFNSEFCDMLVTPEHRVLCSYDERRKRVRMAIECEHHNLKFPIAGFLHTGVKGPRNDEIKLCAAFCGDGSAPPKGQEISWNLKKARKIDRLKTILERLKIPYVVKNYPSTPGWSDIRIKRSSAMFLLSMFPKKKIEYDCVAGWSLEKRRKFLNELGFWDGDFVGKKGVRFFTGKIEEAEAVSRIATVSGYGSILRVDRRPGRNPQYVLNLVNSTWRKISKPPTKVKYNGKVYCCTVPTGFLVTRRNGKPTISGNCEGEKKVHALQAIGITATCWPGGCNGRGKVDWSPLAGKMVYIWPDNDAPGRAAMTEIITILETLTPRPDVAIVDIDALKLPDGGDVVDFLAPIPGPKKYNRTMELLNDHGQPIGPLAELHAMYAQAKSGHRLSVPLAWPEISQAALPLLPGSVLVFCGAPGCNKSMALLQNMLRWLELEIKACCYMLEEEYATHLRRLNAMICGDNMLAYDSWCANPENHATVDRYEAEAAPTLKRLAPYIEILKENAVLSVDAVIQWVAERAAAGNRVIAIDPITMLDKGRDSWNDDMRLMRELKRIARKHQAAIWITTHPKENSRGKRRDSGELAGGQAYDRFSTAQIYVTAHKQKDVNIITPQGVLKYTTNRTMYVYKANHSNGKGKKFGFFFDEKSLSFKECGMLAD